MTPSERPEPEGSGTVSSLLGLLDRWVPDDIRRAGGDRLRKVRVAVAILWVLPVPLVAVLLQLVADGRLVSAAVLSPSLLAPFGGLWIVRRTGRTGFVGHATVVVLSMGTVHQVSAGADVFHTTMIAYVGFPVMVTFMSGPRSGWVWCAIGTTLHVAVGLRTAGDPAEIRMHVFTLVAISVTLTGIAHAFESLRARSIAELEGARIEAQAAAEARSRFLASMSHEIRTPMNGMLGMLSLLEDELEGEARGFAHTAHVSGLALLDLLNDILDFSKIDAGQMMLDRAPFELRATVEDAVQQVVFAARLKGLEVSASIDPEVPDEVVGDRGKVRQVLLNLLSNAVKFTAKGSIVVTVEPGAAAGPSASVRFSVEDTGTGISAEHHDMVFDAFQQVDGSSTREQTGTGLGLAIVREIVLLMDGELGLLSEPGVGSTFWFELPLPAAVEESDASSRSDDGSGRASSDSMVVAPSLDGMRVLVVDDNRINRKVAEHMLVGLGCEVDVAVDGQEAVERTAVGSYEMVLMDVQMPRVDGIQATETIRAREAGGDEHLPIVAMTAHALAVDRERCLAAGMDGYLSKPIQRRDLVRELRRNRVVAG